MIAPADIRAAHLARQHSSWIRCYSKLTSRPVAFGVPSQTQPGVYHLANTRDCSCIGFQTHGHCVHQLAVKIRVAECKALKGTAA